MKELILKIITFKKILITNIMNFNIIICFLNLDNMLSEFGIRNKILFYIPYKIFK